MAKPNPLGGGAGRELFKVFQLYLLVTSDDMFNYKGNPSSEGNVCITQGGLWREITEAHTPENTRHGLCTPVGGLGFLLSPEAALVCLLTSLFLPLRVLRDGSASVLPRWTTSLQRSGERRRRFPFLFFFFFIDATKKREQNVNLPNANFPLGNQALWGRGVRTHSNMVYCVPRCASLKTENMTRSGGREIKKNKIRFMGSGSGVQLYEPSRWRTKQEGGGGNKKKKTSSKF